MRNKYTKENYILLLTKNIDVDSKIFKAIVARVNSLNESKIKYEMNLLYGRDLERFLRAVKEY